MKWGVSAASSYFIRAYVSSGSGGSASNAGLRDRRGGGGRVCTPLAMGSNACATPCMRPPPATTITSNHAPPLSPPTTPLCWRKRGWSSPRHGACVGPACRFVLHGCACLCRSLLGQFRTQHRVGVAICLCSGTLYAFGVYNKEVRCVGRKSTAKTVGAHRVSRWLLVCFGGVFVCACVCVLCCWGGVCLCVGWEGLLDSAFGSFLGGAQIKARMGWDGKQIDLVASLVCRMHGLSTRALRCCCGCSRDC